MERGTAVHALSGIADPLSFERSLEALGLRVTGASRYPDHHPFRPAEVLRAAQRAREEGADCLAVTAKDYVRWPVTSSERLPVPAVFDVDVEMEREDLFLEAVRGVLEEARRWT
jgi:tetraacyldisaccharide 4'-kinase